MLTSAMRPFARHARRPASSRQVMVCQVTSWPSVSIWTNASIWTVRSWPSVRSWTNGREAEESPALETSMKIKTGRLTFLTKPPLSSDKTALFPSKEALPSDKASPLLTKQLSFRQSNPTSNKITILLTKQPHF